MDITIEVSDDYAEKFIKMCELTGCTVESELNRYIKDEIDNGIGQIKGIKEQL